MGRGGRARHGHDVAAALRSARAAAGGPRLPRGRAEHPARGARASGRRARVRRRRPRRHRRLPRHARLAGPDRAGARLAAAPPPRAARARRAPAPAARAGARRGAPDRRAHARRRAAERRRDHGQARAHRRRRRRLRGNDGRGQGRGLDRRRARVLGPAGGHPPGRRRRRPAPGARPWPGGHRRALGLRAHDLRRGAGAAAADRLRRGVRVGSGRAADARRRLRPARGQLPVRPVPARPAPPRLRAGARADGGGRAVVPARRRRPRVLRPHRAGRARGHRRAPRSPSAPCAGRR